MSTQPARRPPSVSQQRALGWLTLALALFAGYTLRHFLPVMIVAAWVAGLSHPLLLRVSSRLSARPRMAALVTVLLLLAILSALTLVALPLALMLRDGLDVVHSEGPQGAFHRLVFTITGHRAPAEGDLVRDVMHRAQGTIPATAALATRVVGLLSGAVVQLVLLVTCTYFFSLKGPRILAQARRSSPLAPQHFDRLLGRFMAVARAILVGQGLTAVLQGTVAGVLYAIFRVPGAFAFAVLTAVAATVPPVGSALVWMPVSALLLLAGRTRDALILGVCGIVLIATIDNVVRPLFARLGAAEVHPLVVLLGVFGGLATFGPWGLVLGPLVLSLFLAAQQCYAEYNAALVQASEPLG